MDGQDVRRGVSGQKKEKTHPAHELEGREAEKRNTADHGLVINGFKLI